MGALDAPRRFPAPWTAEKIAGGYVVREDLSVPDGIHLVFRPAHSPELIMGESVRATMADTVTAPTSVNANSVNSAPVSPPCKPIGT